MATYTYRCNNTECELHIKQLTFEVTQSVHDEPLKNCPECSKDTLERIVVAGTSFRIGGLGVHKPTSMFGY